MIPLRRGTLRARLFAVLAESPLPVSTVDLALLAAFEYSHRDVRVYQILKDEEGKGRVERLPPLPRRELVRGRKPFRWTLTPAGRSLFRGRRKGVLP